MLPLPGDLTYFYAVANASSFSQAAIKLNTSQPSLSIAIKRLETLLDRRLFIRHQRGVTLTPAGVELFKHTQELLEKWQALKNKIQQTDEEIIGKITIGCNSTITATITNTLADLLKQYPQLDIHLEHGLSIDITKEIILGNIDIGIIIHPKQITDIILIKLKPIEFTFWSAQKNDSMLENVCIIYDHNVPNTNQFLTQLRTHYKKHFRLTQTNRFETIATMVLNHLGIGILPSCWVEKVYKNKLFKLQNVPTMYIDLYLAYNYQRKDISALQVVINALKKCS